MLIIIVIACLETMGFKYFQKQFDCIDFVKQRRRIKNKMQRHVHICTHCIFPFCVSAAVQACCISAQPWRQFWKNGVKNGGQ